MPWFTPPAWYRPCHEARRNFHISFTAPKVPVHRADAVLTGPLFHENGRMNTTISNSGLPKLQQAPGQAGGNQATDSSSAAGSSAPAAKSDDQLKLTDSAKALQEAARTNSSAIDTQRVQRVQNALASGSYKIDAGRIADGLISMERQLGGPSQA